MDNEVLQSLRERKSVRVFTGKKITAEEKQIILQAATEAPTAGNQQLYSIIDITDSEIKEKLAVSCDGQPFIAKADTVLIFAADVQKWYDTFVAAGAEPRKPQVGDMMLAVADSLVAAQNAVTAAQSIGIGSCYIGDIWERYEYHKELLRLPDYVFPAAMLVLGYPTEQQQKRPKPQRCELADIVMENCYRQKDQAELKKMFAAKYKNSSFEDWAKAFCARKYNSDFSAEMSRSVELYLSLFR